MNDNAARTVNFAAPAGYDASFTMPDQTSGRLTRAADEASPAPGLAVGLVAAKPYAKVDYAPLGVGVVAALLLLALVLRHLKGAGERMRVIAADLNGTSASSWLPEDDHVSRVAFETRYSRRSLR